MTSDEQRELGDQLTDLANKLVKQALEPTVDLDTRLDVLKTAGNFYIAAIRARLKNDDDDGVASFDKFRNRIAGVDDGHA